MHLWRRTDWWGPKSWESRRLFAETLCTFWILFLLNILAIQKKKKSNKKQTKSIMLWKLPAVPSLSANIKSITDHRIQANIRKEMRRFSAFRTLLPSDGKEAISEIHAACVWKCTLPACILYSNNFCHVKAMWKERTERKIGKKLLQ